MADCEHLDPRKYIGSIFALYYSIRANPCILKGSEGWRGITAFFSSRNMEASVLTQLRRVHEEAKSKEKERWRVVACVVLF